MVGSVCLEFRREVRVRDVVLEIVIRVVWIIIGDRKGIMGRI